MEYANEEHDGTTMDDDNIKLIIQKSEQWEYTKNKVMNASKKSLQRDKYLEEILGWRSHKIQNNVNQVWMW